MAIDQIRTVDDVRSLADLVRFQARERGDKVALSFEGRDTTYGAFDSRTNQVANGLIAEGVGPQARVRHWRLCGSTGITRLGQSMSIRLIEV